MTSLALREFHSVFGAQFTELNGQETVALYGDTLNEHAVLNQAAGLMDLSCRGRLCLTGSDRKRFLNGQVTNNVHDLKAGEGCYAALVTAKGKMLSDLNIYLLENEILLDFEPGYGEAIARRLEKYIIADDVQIVDVAPHYGLLSVQGPRAGDIIRHLDWGVELPPSLMSFAIKKDPVLGEIYLMNQPRVGTSGYDVFAPIGAVRAVADQLMIAAKSVGGILCGWQALEMARIEAGIPRFGVDMDESNLPPETGLETRAISYSKGCYIGQEVIARIRTYGQVAKALRGLRLADDLKQVPIKGDKLFKDGKEAGYITSALASPTFHANIALGYVRRGANQIGTELRLHAADGETEVRVAPLPFTADPR